MGMRYNRLTRRNKDGTTWVKCAKCDIQDKCDFTKETCCQEMQDRLAELEDKIESGTLKETTICKNITKCHPVDEFICSECGLILQDYCKKRLDEDGDENLYEFEIKYCPTCGAKVVEE